MTAEYAPVTIAVTYDRFKQHLEIRPAHVVARYVTGFEAQDWECGIITYFEYTAESQTWCHGHDNDAAKALASFVALRSS